MQAAEEGSYVTKKEGSFSPRPPDNVQKAAAMPTGNGFAAGKIITTVENLARNVGWLLSLPELLKHLQEKILQVLKKRRVKLRNHC